MYNSVWRPIQRGIGFGQPAPPRRSLLGFIKKFFNDWSTDFGSLLAYNFLVALLPIAVTAFGILGLVFRNNPSAQQSVIDSIVDSLPDNNTKAGVREVTEIAANNLAHDAGAILAIGIVFAIYGGSRLFVVMEKILDIIHRAPSRSFLKQNLVAIGMLILFIILIILIIGAAGVPSFLINTLASQNGAQFGIFIAGILVSILVAFILFFVIYLLVPNKKMKLAQNWCGALIAAILLDIFLVLFPLYIRRFMGSFLGLIGFAILLILFFYYFGLVLILGAQINAYFFERHQPLPEDLATFTSQTLERSSKPRPASLQNTVSYPRYR